MSKCPHKTSCVLEFYLEPEYCLLVIEGFFFYTINAWFIKVRLGWSSAGIQQDTAQRSQNKMVKALPHISISCAADQDGSCDPFTAGPEFLQGGTSGVCDIS